jgi:hypothetical protein
MSNNEESSTSRLNPESKINEDKNPILESKQFTIKTENEEYYIKIEINNKYIYFTLTLSDRIVDISYQNKYDLNAIVRLLNLIPNKYKNLSQVLKFIEKAYSMNKISIIQDEFNVVVSIKIPIGFEEEEYKLTLYKVILSNNEIINQIVKELNFIKKIVLNKDQNNISNNNLYFNNNNTTFNINEKINELNNKINSKDSLINELYKKMNIKDKEIKDIYNKLKDKNYLINEMNKTLKIKDSQMLFQNKERTESINQLKIKDEEINKKLNDKAYEIDNKFIDKDNALNEINKKLIEKEYIINQINNNLVSKENEIKKQDEKINELKRYISKITEENNNKINELKNILFDLEEIKSKYKGNLSNFVYNNYYSNYNNISNSMYNDNSRADKNNPQNLKLKQNIVTTNTKGGLNDIFEVFTSLKDKTLYLVSPNKNNFNLDLITLIDNKLKISLKGHLKKVTNVRYFLNNFTNEDYLISADESGIVNLWDISNNYSKKYSIDTNYNDIIYSCLLVFTNNENFENSNNDNKGYIITSTYGISDENEKSSTKIYSMENNGEFMNYFSNTNNNSIYYLLSWFNKKNNKYYIIQFSHMKIFINNLLEDELYAELTQEQKLSHYSGFIYEIDENKCYLFSSSKNGFINVWNLYKKNLVHNINVNGSILCHIIQWDDKYAIVADYNGKSFKIIDIQSYYIVKDINGGHNKEVKTIKKINHPIYGDSLLSAGNDYTIKLWCI